LRVDQIDLRAACHISAEKQELINVTMPQRITKNFTSRMGLFQSIASIFSIISSVGRGRTSSALRFSCNYSGELAPRMTLDVFGFLATHAKARALGVV
jgi:hypothetical protein